MASVSIALCTYNGEEFLAEQLRSYLTQTRLPDELVVCDDGSTDGTVRILEEFREQASFPVSIYLNKPNLGSTKNFEKAISLCVGDLIFLSDQDDVWRDNKIERITKSFENDAETGLIFTNAQLVNDRLQPLGVDLWDINFHEDARRQASAGRMIEMILNRDIITGATVAFRSLFKDAIRPIPNGLTQIIHDKWIALAIACQANINFLPESLILYRQHSRQQIGASLPPPELSNSQAKMGRVEFCKEATEYNNLRLIRIEELKRGLSEHSASESARSQRYGAILAALLREENDARSALLHFGNRRLIRSRSFSSVFLLFRELLSGRYATYSRGWLSATKDLFVKF